MSGLRLRYIEVFLSLMQTGSTQGAAMALHTTQPNISKALGALERQLGFQLFVRTGSGLKPTADAFALFSEADRVHEEVTAFRRMANELRDGRAYPLNLLVSPALTTAILPQAVANYKKSWPATTLSIAAGRTDMIVNSVQKQLADVGIIVYSDHQELGQVKKLHTSAMVCIVRKDHSLAELAVITPTDLKNEQLVAYGSSLGFSRVVESAFSQAGIEPKFGVTVNYTSAIYALVNAGGGVAVVDRFSLAEPYQNIVALPFEPQCFIHIGLVVSDQRPLSMQAERFIAAFVKCLPED